MSGGKDFVKHSGEEYGTKWLLSQEGENYFVMSEQTSNIFLKRVLIVYEYIQKYVTL